MTNEQKLKMFSESIFHLEQQDLERMLIDLAWKNYTIDHLVDSVVEEECQNQERTLMLLNN